MEFLAIGFIIYVVFLFLRKPMKVETDAAETIEIKVKKCPPHQWFWQEMVDQDGVGQGARIVCKVCGPLSKSLDGSIE
jgi:hypothetical protein